MTLSNNTKNDTTQHILKKKKTQKMGIKDNLFNFLKNTYKNI